MPDAPKRIVLESLTGKFEDTEIFVNGKKLTGGGRQLAGFSIFGEGPMTVKGEDGEDKTFESYFGMRVTVRKSGGEDEEEQTTLKISNSAVDDGGLLVEDAEETDHEDTGTEDLPGGGDSTEGGDPPPDSGDSDGSKDDQSEKGEVPSRKKTDAEIRAEEVRRTFFGS